MFLETLSECRDSDELWLGTGGMDADQNSFVGVVIVCSGLAVHRGKTLD
jgi:hypothetical protein